MENVLLVTASKKSADMLIDLIHSSGWHPDRILAAASCSEARAGSSKTMSISSSSMRL